MIFSLCAISEKNEGFKVIFKCPYIVDENTYELVILNGGSCLSKNYEKLKKVIIIPQFPPKLGHVIFEETKQFISNLASFWP